MDVFDLYAKLSLDSSGYDRALNDAAANGSTFATKFAIGLKTAGTAIGSVVKQAVTSYGEYEQLVGGVDTLFKSSSKKVQQYAANAYKTSGLSANQYMNTVTSFSASLLQSLGGNTEAAADYAEMAITDMADNANKMGTSIGSIQSAYQGFAKQNYTMLDNLKLGYGGTKTEMERLVNDAEKLDKSFKATRDANGDLALSYSDIVDAIHIVQTNMGITGTTAKEADSTIQGSLASVKASWENLITGLSDENADLETLFTNLFDSVETAAGNIVPRVEQALYGIGDSISIIIPEVIKKVPEVVEKLPDVVEAGKSILTNLVSGLADSVEEVTPKLTEGLTSLIKKIGELADGDSGGDLAKAGNTLLSNLAKAMVDAVPNILTTLTEVITNLTDNLSSAAENTDPYSSGETALTILQNLAEKLSEKIAEVLPDLTSAASEFISAFVDKVGKDTTDFTNTAISILNKLINGLSGSVPQVMEDISTAVLAIVNAIIDTITGFDYQTLMDSAVTLVKAVSDGVVAAAGTIAEGLPEIINKIGEWLKTEGNLSGLVDGAAEIISSLAGGLITSVNLILEKLPGIILEILSWFNTEGNLSSLAGGATKILSTLASGITSTISTLTEKLPELITGIFNWLTDTTHLTEMLSAGTTIFSELVKDVPTIITALVGGIGSIIAGIVKELTSAENLKKVADSALTIFGEIVKNVPAILLGLTEGLTSLVSGIVGKVKGLFQKDENSGEMESGLKEGLSGAFNKFKGNIGAWWESDGKATFDEIGKKWKEFFQQFEWGNTFVTFCEDIGNKIKALWGKAQSAFTGETGFFGKVKTWIGGLNLSEAGQKFVESLKSGITKSWENAKAAFTGVNGLLEKVKNWLGNLDFSEAGESFVKALKTGISGAWDSVTDWFKNPFGKNDQEQVEIPATAEIETVEMPENMIKLDYNNLNPLPDNIITSYQNFAEAIDSVNTATENLASQGESFVQAFIDAMSKKIEEVKEVGKNLVDGLWEGISSNWDSFAEKVMGLSTDLVEQVKNVYQVSSPSKVFAEIGKHIDEGFAQGIENYSGLIDDSMKSITQIPTVNTDSALSGTNYGGFTFNIYSQPGMDEMTLARLVADQVRDQVVSIGAAA